MSQAVERPCRIKNSSSIKAVDGVALNSQYCHLLPPHLHHNYNNMNYSAINQTSTNPDTSFITNNSNSNIMSNNNKTKTQLPPPPPLVSQVVSVSTICIANDSKTQDDNMTLDPKSIKSPPFIATRTRSQLDTSAARRQLKLKRRNSIEHQLSTRRSQRRRVTVDSCTDKDVLLNSLVSNTGRKTEQQQLKPRSIHTLSSSISSNETVSDDTSIVDLVSSFSDSISIKDELAATNLAYLDELASELDFVWDQNEITMLQYDPTKKN